MNEPDANVGTSAPELLEVGALPTIEDFGFTGGRQGLRAFCEAAFKPGTPRFMRNSDYNLVVFRNEDVRALAARPEVGAVAPGILFFHITDFSNIEPGTIGGGIAEVLKNQIFTMNPPVHTSLRRILMNQMNPKPVNEFAALADDVVNGILAELPDQGEIDLVRDVTEKLTVRFWGSILSMTAEEMEAVTSHIRNMAPMFEIQRSLEGFEQLDRAALDYHRTVGSVVTRSLANRVCPMAQRVATELEGVDLADEPKRAGIVPKNAGAFFSGNLVDAFHTAAVGAANVIHVLLQNTHALGNKPLAPEVISAAVREALRLEPPVIYLQRMALEDFVYDGVRIQKDTIIAMMWAAANHDPTAFENPAKFDIGRSVKKQTTFGGGVHICAGRHMALMLIQTLVERLFNGDISLEAQAEGEWVENFLMSQFRAMPLKIKRNRG